MGLVESIVLFSSAIGILTWLLLSHFQIWHGLKWQQQRPKIVFNIQDGEKVLKIIMTVNDFGYKSIQKFFHYYKKINSMPPLIFKHNLLRKWWNSGGLKFYQKNSRDSDKSLNLIKKPTKKEKKLFPKQMPPN